MDQIRTRYGSELPVSCTPKNHGQLEIWGIAQHKAPRAVTPTGDSGENLIQSLGTKIFFAVPPN